MGFETKSWQGRFDFFRHCLAAKYHWIIELHQSGSSGKILHLVSLFTQSRYFFHNHHTDKGPIHRQGLLRPIIQKDLDACWSFNQLVLGKKEAGACPDYLNYAPQLKSKKAITKERQLIFSLVATRESKKWPIDYFLELAGELKEWKILIPLSTSADDQKIKQALELKNLPSHVSIIQQSLSQLAQTIASSMAYIGNDTGLKHLSAALGLPTLTFFGPEDPYEWHPYAKDQHPYLYLENLPCRSELEHFCPLDHCPTHFCLRTLDAQLALEKFKSLGL